MQNLDIISVNLWQILISLLNLTLLFLIIKMFLFKPVKKMLKQRQDEIDEDYKTAEQARTQAEAKAREVNEQLGSAKARAEQIIKDAAATADIRGEKIVAEAKAEAEDILRKAKAEAVAEKKRAQSEIKGEIVGISAALAEKLLEREITARDHKALIDSYIGKIGEEE